MKNGILVLLTILFVLSLVSGAEDIHQAVGQGDSVPPGNGLDYKLKENKMSDSDSDKKTIPERNKVPGIAYAYTDCGLELAVLDITHPMFIKSINEEGLEDLCKQSAQLAKMTREMPEAQRNAIMEMSFIFGKYFHKGGDVNYLSGMSTYMLKLGPYLLGGGEERNMDRMIAMGVSSVSARMRLRDMCGMQADALIPRLKASPKTDLCLINIAGGAASDSINTLILILKENKSLLENRKIEIDVFDIDSDSPAFARRCVEALKTPGHHFHGLEISFNHITYDWTDTGELITFLTKRKGRIMTCTTEGGLFEYASDKDIISNLDALCNNSPVDMRITGSLLHDIDTVDPTIPAMAEVSGGGLRFLGTEGLENILKKTKWKIESIKNGKNPVYIILTLEKCLK